MSDLENTVAALKSEFQKTLSDKTENQKCLEESLATAKHDLLRVQEQLSMAEKVCMACACPWSSGGRRGKVLGGRWTAAHSHLPPAVDQCVF